MFLFSGEKLLEVERKVDELSERMGCLQEQMSEFKDIVLELKNIVREQEKHLEEGISEKIKQARQEVVGNLNQEMDSLKSDFDEKICKTEEVYLENVAKIEKQCISQLNKNHTSNQKKLVKSMESLFEDSAKNHMKLEGEVEALSASMKQLHNDYKKDKVSMEKIESEVRMLLLGSVMEKIPVE